MTSWRGARERSEASDSSARFRSASAAWSAAGSTAHSSAGLAVRYPGEGDGVTVGSVDPGRIAEVKDFALAEAARPALGAAGFTLVSLSALLATLSAVNATVYGSARLGFALAREGELPAVLERRAWSEPVWAVVAVGLLSLALANGIDVSTIAVLASAGFLLLFAVTNAAAVKPGPEMGRGRAVPALACAACTGSLVVLLVETGRHTPGALLAFGALIGGVFLFELGYGRRRGPVRPHS
jgi:amino acid transporter